MKTHNQDKKGFTIIEVVLVLAIAGLIFLIVFLAVPALQRSQRDTQRRNDLGRFMSQVTNYQSNNNGVVPTEVGIGNFVNSYLVIDDDQFGDPTTGSTYVTTSPANVSETPAGGSGKIYYFTSAKCNGESAASTSGNRTVAAVVGLEGGGSFCQDNR